jgi:hypothetical protein
MRSFRQTTRHWKIKTSKRGHFKVHNVTLVSSDLLGSSAISQVIPVELELTVLPRPLDLEDMQLFPRHVSGDMVVKRNLLTDPFFIAGIRPYTGHEPLSRIHWNATAKEQELMVFQNESTARQNLTVLLNMQSREHEHHEIIDREVVENGIRCCAAVLDRACETQMPVRVLSNGTICEDKSHTAGKFAVKEEDRPKDIDTGEDWGEEHTLTVLRTLADLQGYTVEEFPKWLNQQQEQQKIESSDVVLITGYLNDEICAFAREKQLNGVNVQIFLLNRGTYLPDDLQICQV